MTNFKPFKVSNYITPEEALKKLENYHPPKTPEPPVEKTVITPSIITAVDIQSPENWLFIESRQHGIYTQPDLLVNLYRLNATPEVQKAAQSINLAVADTALQKDGHISHNTARISTRSGLPNARRKMSSSARVSMVFTDTPKAAGDGAEFTSALWNALSALTSSLRSRAVIGFAAASRGDSPDAAAGS